MPSYNRKDFKQSNVNYLNKDFNSLKQSLINYAKSYFPNTYRDFNETSPGMMLLEMNAYVGDVLSFYIDQQHREMLLPLAEERRSVLNLAKMFGYKVKPIIPATTELSFRQTVDAADDASKIDYQTSGVFNSGIQVASNIDSSIVFETLDIVDFSITGSDDTDGNRISENDASTGLATKYTISRKVKAVSGETKTKTFNVGVPTKFLKLTLEDTNVIDIISCKDANGNNWYEVDFLAQDKVPIETHYTNDDTRASNTSGDAYFDTSGNRVITDVAIPYSLTYRSTTKRFTRETNQDNTTSLVFGNGILNNGQTIDGQFLDLEQVGIVVPGQANSLQNSINPLLGDEYSTLGETPNNTTMTITYRVGGGISSNVPAGALTSIVNSSRISGQGTLLDVTNDKPAVGGKDEETIEEIKEQTKAFFTTQNRCVTKEDYEARVLNIPPKFGNIAKVYVSRVDTTQVFGETTTDIIETVSENVASLNEVQSRYSVNSLISEAFQAYATTNESGNTIYNGVPESLRSSIESSINFNTNLVNNIPTYTNNITNQIGLLPENPALTLGSIDVFVLAYNNTKNLVGNPIAGTTGFEDLTDGIPVLLQNNIKNYLSNFKILTDDVNIKDGHIINFGVFFDVVSHKYANKNEVKLLCIEKIKDYFKIEKMQFSQPIYVSQLEYELMDIDGVRAVNYVTISQTSDYNTTGGADFGQNLYTYQFDTETGGIQTPDNGGNGVNGYGWYYDFQTALTNGTILPPHPDNPGVFELKNPNQNIKGVVR